MYVCVCVFVEDADLSCDCGGGAAGAAAAAAAAASASVFCCFFVHHEFLGISPVSFSFCHYFLEYSFHVSASALVWPKKRRTNNSDAGERHPTDDSESCATKHHLRLTDLCNRSSLLASTGNM